MWSQSSNSHELISLEALGSLMGRKRESGQGRRKMDAGRDFGTGHRARLRGLKGKGQVLNATVI